jgi:hypothetical protein
MLSLYFHMNGWAVLIGQVCGVAAITGFYLYQDECHQWNSAYAWKKDSYVYDEVRSMRSMCNVRCSMFDVQCSLWAF